MKQFYSAFLIFIFITVTLWAHKALAQSVAVSGIVRDGKGVPVPGATVSLLPTAKRTSTAQNGYYRFEGVLSGDYMLRCTAVGYETKEQRLVISGSTSTANIVLQENTQTLNEVSVAEKSKALSVAEQPQSVSVIDAKRYYNRPEGAIALINQAVGIKVRQSGGLGSYADIYINGLSGKQVKFFLDGIPLDYLGAGLNLNILPINVIDRIEIYKGVIPVNLGADALGGAIDVITRHSLKNYLDASIEAASFGTQRFQLNFHRIIKPDFYADFTGFYNHANNDYRIDAEIPENGTQIPANVKLFHNRFSDLYGNLSVGLTNQKWADNISLFTAVSTVNQQVQNNRFMTQPYGHVNYDEQSWNNGVKYLKTLASGRLAINAYAGINISRTHYLDTSLNTYLWTGEAPAYARRNSGGESGPLQNTFTNIVNRIARVNLSYALSGETKISANILGNSYSQRDNNPLSAAFPVSLRKLVAGAALEQDLFDHALTSISSVKYFNYSDQGFTISTADNRTLSAAGASRVRMGISEALKWQVNEKLLAKASYEYATRLPDEQELFGTYLNRTYPNPSLSPEISHNINAGLLYTLPKGKLELNGFYRLADNLIYSPPSSSPTFVIYQNLLKGQITGIEGQFAYHLIPELQLTLNGTYQNYVSRTSADHAGTGGYNGYYGQRLPNIPFLFANGELAYTKGRVFRPDGQLTTWYNASYVHWFYLYWAKDGDPDQKLRIPTQYVQTAGITYAVRQNRYAVSISVANLADAKVYDNYGVQLPGRSIHIKLRTFID